MMMHCPSPSGGQVAPLLISIALGYGVLLLARRESRPLNRIGKFVGWFVMTVAFVGLLCIAATGLCRMCPVKGGYMKGRAAMCPFGGPKGACVPPMASDTGAEPPAQNQ